jgi:ATP-dependent helicase HrpB
VPEDALHRLVRDPPPLPVAAGLPGLLEAVEATGTAVLQAPPGTGKTTLVPPALAVAAGSARTPGTRPGGVLGGRPGRVLVGQPGRVLVAQPRRLAARAAARRLASLLGEPVGGSAGYAVRGERRAGPATRVEMVTNGVLLRRLQRDPELPGVAAVVLDECHERHLDADLLLALLVDVRANLRDDLRLVAMSATVEAARTAEVVGGDGGPAPVVDVPGVSHPVQVRWSPPPPRVPRIDERGVTPGYLDHVAATVRRALDAEAGDVLVFVPGAGEVTGVVRRLAGVDADVRPLHGRLTAPEQDAALTRGARRRVVVSTAVAESSVTVPGVRVVVDAGLARQPRTDHRRGLAGLVTVLASRPATTQRAGRAGREAPGAVYRCWSPAEHERLPARTEPEIATADLTGFALELACWGAPDGAGLALLDPPPAAAMAAARSTLRGLGAMDEAGRVTARGRAVADVPADPRSARALLDAVPLVGRRRAAEVVALLEEDVRAPGADLAAALRQARRDAADRPTAWSRAVDRFLVDLPAPAHASANMHTNEAERAPAPANMHIFARRDGRVTDDVATGLVAALAHPDRIARLRTADGTSYLMTGGTGAVLPDGSPLRGAPWLAIADADRPPGRRDATIRSAAPLDEDLAVLAARPLLTEEEQVAWVDGDVVARLRTSLGAIELATRPLPDPPADRVAAAVRDGLAAEGLTLLTWSDAATALRQRLTFLHRTLGDPWPDMSDDALLRDVENWLGPRLSRVRGRADLRRVDVADALRQLLPWPEAGRLDELAPERVRLPSGSLARVDYSGEQPVLPVRVQEVFGWTAAPRLGGGRVPLVLHLLSPAGRPAAVTADLPSFWANGYRQVRAELRRRYPRHSWPEDGATAEPTSRAARRPR